MRKTINLPAPQLSQLKRVSIDLDMSGRHYALLASCEGQLPEDVAFSILKDLVEEDASKLTLSEVRYLFMLVKINSLENKYSVNVECTHVDEKGKPCGCNNTFDVFLSDQDLNPTPPDYKVPTIVFRANDTEKEYSVIPPTIANESKLYNYFLTEKNATPEQIPENKELSFEYTFIRSMLHLVDSNDNRLISDDANFADVMNYLDDNKFQTINHLIDKVIEVNKFGVQNKVYKLKCKECGKTLVFQLPLLNGLLD